MNRFIFIYVISSVLDDLVSSFRRLLTLRSFHRLDDITVHTYLYSLTDITLFTVNIVLNVTHYHDLCMLKCII